MSYDVDFHLLNSDKIEWLAYKEIHENSKGIFDYEINITPKNETSPHDYFHISCLRKTVDDYIRKSVLDYFKIPVDFPVVYLTRKIPFTPDFKCGFYLNTFKKFKSDGYAIFGNIIEKKKKTFLIKTNKNLNFSKKLKPIFNLGISEIKNFDNVVKQSTPLGINSINCLSSERSKIRKKPSQSKIERWKKIAASSCEQCGMDWVPEIYSNELMSWAHNSNDSLKIVLNPRAAKSIKEFAKFPKSLFFATKSVSQFKHNK